MHRTLFFLVCLLLPIAIFAQIGVNTTNPDTSSILDISSTNKGLLIPRMGTGDWQAIKNPRNSLLVYDTSSAKYMYCLAGKWYELNPITAPFTHDSVTISKKLSVGNPSNPTGQKLTVNGSAVVKEGIVAKQVTVGTNGLSVQGQTVLSQNLEVGGKITTLGNIDAGGTINATGISVPGFGLVPRGIIVMWSGSPTDIPTGWAICAGQTVLSDGQQFVTPDLRGRFILGQGINANPDPRETLNPYYNVGDKGGISAYKFLKIESALPDHTHGVPWNHGRNNLDFNNNFDFPGGDEENTDGSIPTHGQGWDAISSHENRPPFYVLAYIVKL